jgi:hypothetical protein
MEFTLYVPVPRDLVARPYTYGQLVETIRKFDPLSAAGMYSPSFIAVCHDDPLVRVLGRAPGSPQRNGNFYREAHFPFSVIGTRWISMGASASCVLVLPLR